MKKVIMSVGIQGSGKTTALKELAHKYGYTYLCPDDIRKELSGDASDQSRNGEVWEESRNRLKNLLSTEDVVVFDATFTYENQRIDFIRFAKENGAEKVQGIFFDVPLETAKERNLKRERIVPEHAIDRAEASLRRREPTTADGFDSVFTLNEFSNLMKSQVDREGASITKEFKRR